MASPVSESKWVEVGRSTTTDTKNEVRKEVELDNYYVVVGFEVNHPNAFKDDTHDLAVDYGHAFFYIVKNKIITKLFSFGPGGAGKRGWFGKGSPSNPNWYDFGAVLKDGYKNSRPGDPDYPITETIKAFKILLTPKQGKDLERETDVVRQKIRSGKQRYTAYMNDTCAETARDILEDADIVIPEGKGKVKHSDVLAFPIAYSVNPYMWHSNFKKSGSIEVTFKPPTAGSDWHPPTGEMDPIFGSKK